MYCAFVLDTDVLRAGVATSLEALDSAACQVHLLREGLPAGAVLEEASSCLHRAGRVAKTVGLDEISRSAEEVEEALVQLRLARRELSLEELSLLEEAVALLTALLLNVNVRTGLYTVSDGSHCLDRLRSACA